MHHTDAISIRSMSFYFINTPDSQLACIVRIESTHIVYILCNDNTQLFRSCMGRKPVIV